MCEKENNKLQLVPVQISLQEISSLRVCFPYTDHVMLLGENCCFRLSGMCAFECMCRRWNFKEILHLPGFLASFSHALEKEIRSKYND